MTEIMQSNPNSSAKRLGGSPELRDRAREMRSHPTNAEQLLWNRLRRKQIAGYKFRRQQVIGAYIVDFLCLEQELIIEIDGAQHAESKEYDAVRSEWLGSQGFIVLRFWNNQVLTEIDGVIQVVLDTIQH